MPVTNPESACFMLQNGTLQPIAYSLTTATTATTNSANQSQQPLPPRTPHNEMKTCTSSGSGNEILKAINKRDGIAKYDNNNYNISKVVVLIFI